MAANSPKWYANARIKTRNGTFLPDKEVSTSILGLSDAEFKKLHANKAVRRGKGK